MLDFPHGTAMVLRRSLLSKPETAKLMHLSRYQLEGLITDGRVETRDIRGRTYCTAGSIRRAMQWLADSQPCPVCNSDAAA